MKKKANINIWAACTQHYYYLANCLVSPDNLGNEGYPPQFVVKN
jgi:hypothetical protein